MIKRKEEMKPQLELHMVLVPVYQIRFWEAVSPIHRRRQLSFREPVAPTASMVDIFFKAWICGGFDGFEDGVWVASLSDDLGILFPVCFPVDAVFCVDGVLYVGEERRRSDLTTRALE
ncbi:hypothetical protein YC2023_022401 [Brassica napus]